LAVLDRVLETISRYNMLPEGVRVIAAVSGGADSVCLLHVLLELAPKSVAGVAHFNHKWRADASDADEAFVKDLALRLNLPFFRAETQRIRKGNQEQQARRDRQAFFSQIRAEDRAAPGTLVALGHTRDDQAETVLFRLVRGSGLAGIAAIPPVAEGIIRPLIDVTRNEIEAFLLERRIPWCDDASNADRKFARNRIRHDLLPQLARDWNPQIVDALANLADLAREEEKYWRQEIDRLAVDRLVLRDDGVELHPAGLPKAAARRLIRHAIALAKGDLRQIDFNHVESVLNLKRTVKLPGLTVTRSFDWLRFAPSAAPPPPAARTITQAGVYPSPDRQSEICVDLAESDPCVTLNREGCQVRTPLEIRGWRPGDHYRPQGQSRDQKVQEMFQKARVPSWRRASWPILSCGDKIVWSRQFGVADEFATVLRIRERGLC
jgi:tRNA(Ile)-lysidine synthase